MMSFGSITKLIGYLLAFFASTLLLPLIVETIYHDGKVYPYIYVISFALIISFILINKKKEQQLSLSLQESFLFIVLSWIVMVIIAAIPFKLMLNISIVDSIFEAASGLTTTGAETLLNLKDLPHSILFYHQYLQFLGGMGVIVLATTILPVLNNKYAIMHDSPNQIANIKLVPKIINTAKILWGLYLFFTALCFFCYWLFGMTAFEAISQAFTTISTGGFSIHSSSFGHYNSNGIYWTSIVFMLIGAIGFNLHFKAIIQKNWKCYIKNKECRTFILITIILSFVVLLMLNNNNRIDINFNYISSTVFNCVSLVSTTGYTTDNFAYWPSFLPILLILFGAIGGCSGSTSGGIKINRAIAVYYHAIFGLKSLAQPNAVFTNEFINYQNPKHSFLALFIIVYIVFLLAFMGCGYDFETAFAAITACLSNVGAAINALANNYTQLSDIAKIILTIAMIAGRLELMIFFVCFMPFFWLNS